MKIILPISRKTFSEFKTACITQAPHDYYSRVGSRGSSCYHQDEARFYKREAEYIAYANEVLNAQFPFNLFKQVWNVNERKPLIQNGNSTIYHRYGYYINHEQQCYAYNTCAGNFHGVYKCRETGEYFAFMSGSRHALSVPHSEEDKYNTPVLYETTAPKEMYFFENQCDFMCRMGEKYSAKYFAEHCPDIMFTEYQQYSTDCYNMSDYDVYYHFKRLNENFDNLIFAEIFKSISPEQFLLNKYRNKKFKPELLSGKDLIAWNLLTQDVKERLVKWG